jgi:hypothetical protein
MILLAGSNAALLEGLSQSVASTGTRVLVATTLDEADELRAQHQPILVLVERAFLSGSQAGHPFIGALTGLTVVTYRESGDAALPLAPGLSRLVLAHLELPLERNRLVALVEHAMKRARTVGRSSPVPRPESPAS